MNKLNSPEIIKHLPIVTIYPEHASATTRQGKTKDGREYLIREQVAYINTGKHHPIELKIFIDNNSTIYPAGTYLLSSSAFKIGDFNTLSLNARDFSLIPFDTEKMTAK